MWANRPAWLGRKAGSRIITVSLRPRAFRSEPAVRDAACGALRTAVRAGQADAESGIASKVLGGWAIGAFYTPDAGRPLAVSSPNNTSSFGGGTGERPDATGVSAALPGGPKICDNCAYFNAAAFVQTPQYQFGNVSKYLPDVNNPTSYNIDSSFEKNTRIREGSI